MILAVYGFLSRRIYSSIWLILALIIAAITRLGWPDLIEFKADESAALTLASAIARGQQFPLVGIGSSIGIPNAPFFVYLMALPELVSRDPAVATRLIGILDVASVGLTYAFADRCFGRVPAVAATLLYAVSPWGIIYSRKVWEQDALPCFVTAGFFALFVALLERRRWLLVPGVASLALAGQLHPTAYYLAGPALLLVLGCLVCDSAARPKTLGMLGLGVLLAGALELPYLVWQAQNGWPLLDAARVVLASPGHFDGDALQLGLDLAAGHAYATLSQVADYWWPAYFVELGLLILGSAVAMRRGYLAARPERRFAAGGLILWLVAPILFQSHHSVQLYSHYFIVLFPAPFLIMGLAVQAIGWGTGRGARWFGDRYRAAIAVGVVAIPVALGLIAFADHMRTLERGGATPDFGVPLGRQEALVQAAEGVARGGPVDLGTSDTLTVSLDYLVDGRWRIFDDHAVLIVPPLESGGALVLTDPSSYAGKLAVDLPTGGVVASVPLTADRVAAVYSGFGSARANSGYHLTAAGPGDGHGVSFDNGMVLDGYRIVSDAATREIQIDLLWRFGASVPSVPPRAFNHLLNANGQIQSQIDAPAYPDLAWHPGEVTLSEFRMPWPPAPGTYRIELGLYDLPSLRRHQLTGPAGVSDALIVGPVTIGSGPP